MQNNRDPKRPRYKTAITNLRDIGEYSMLKWKINLLDNGYVVTQDGEYLGTWEPDENDHLSFTPDGESEVLFFDVFTGSLCRKIEEWRLTNSTC